MFNFRKFSIFENFQFFEVFFLRFFEPGFGRIAKTISDSVSEPKKKKRFRMIYCMAIFDKFSKNRKNILFNNQYIDRSIPNFEKRNRRASMGWQGGGLNKKKLLECAKSSLSYAG